MWRLWRDLERRTTHRREKDGAPVAVSAKELARDLQELIDALDRRLPGVARAGELAIVRDAEALRAKAVDRLAELTNTALLQ